MPQFVIQQSESNKWFYEFLSDDKCILLTGTKHEIKQVCLGEIVSVKMNAVYEENFEIRKTPGNDYFFILRSMGNHQIIGISEMYSNKETCEKIISQTRKYIEKLKK